MNYSWQLSDIPAYKGGRLISGEIDCGVGLTRDENRSRETSTYMQLIGGTRLYEFHTYLDALSQAGFSTLYSRSESYGEYAELRRGHRLVYTYFDSASAVARVITGSNTCALCDFGDDSAAETEGSTQLLQYALYYGPMVRYTTCDCGMLYALRTRDNRLILVDGGECEQATDAAIADIFDILCKMTHTPDGGNIRIAAWYCSHPHDDHADVFAKLLRLYNKRISLERVMFNFASPDFIGADPFLERVKMRITEYYPDVKYLKLHTGQRFSLSNIEFDVLLTHEDVYRPDADRKYNGINETSVIMKLSFEGKTLIFLGDAQRGNGEKLVSRYGDLLRCDYLQAAHHCINDVEDIYRACSAGSILMPQSRKNIEISDDKRTIMKGIARYTPTERIFTAGERTLLFTFSGAGTTLQEIPFVGVPYDGSEI